MSGSSRWSWWRRPQADFDAEIQAHIDLEAEQLRAEGWPAEDALWEARRRFGGVTRAQERYYEARRVAWLDALGQDARYALRQLRRAPVFAAVAILTLALGIGANAIIFGVVDRLLLSPPPHVAAPAGVVRVYFHFGTPDDPEQVSPVTSYPMIAALERHVPAFQGVAAVGFPTGTSVGRGPGARSAEVAQVSSNFFQVLGARPARGRFFAPGAERTPGGADVVVLSHGFWRRYFGGAPDVVGRRLELGAKSLTVVGVAPPGFTGVDLAKTDLWVPLAALSPDRLGDDGPARHSFWLRPIARLRDGATPERAAAEGTVVFRQVRRSWSPGRPDTLGGVVAGPLIEARGPAGASREAKVSLWLVGVSAAVLLIACANVANLLLARAVRRRREIAVRLALGAGRGRLVRQMLTEAGALAALAAPAALLATHWGGQLVRAVLLPGVAWEGSPVDGRVLAFTAAATLAAVVLAGLAPALRSGATDLTASLKSGARDLGAGRSALRTGLLVAQAALCAVLLVGAGLFVRSLARVRATDVGVDLPRVLLVRAGLRETDVPRAVAAARYAEAVARARALPGVERAALTAASVPMETASANSVEIPGRDSLPDLPGGGPYYAAVSPDYFAALGARVTRGRGLTEADERAGARVALVNELVARHYWPRGNPVGGCLLLGSDSACYTVVGVVQDVLLFRVVGEERGQLYIPLAHAAAWDRAPGAMVVRVRDGAAVDEVAGALRRELQSIAPDMPYVDVRTFEELVAPELGPWRLGATMFSAFGGLALLIAAVGLYGVLAYAVTQRTPEIGVRLALGAGRGDVVRLVVRDGVRVAAAGLALGLALAVLAAPRAAPLLYETSPRDPLVLGAVALALLAVALVASLVPAWRASRVDPNVALRAE